MQLKSLEIQGFKSFAEKTLFQFDQGVTGIVGPNGCGKSNVVDSIRWVLGEQKTRNLRSEKMENIIFNGTARRKKAHFCQVTLTFENTRNILPTEYAQVAITRKLYRTGESEYMINNVPCRLKDIQNLFLDTGVGPDSYAIIELKMVDEILNDKEGSRRNLFEEAAGISKYKIRKKETLRKLEEAQGDLERVEDVLFEIDKQLKALENQAKKAQKYFELKERYKLLSSRHAFFAIRDLRAAYEAIEAEERGFADRLQEIQSTIARHEARLMELKKEQVDNEQILAEAQKDLNRHNEHIREIEKDKSIQNERLKYLQQREYAITDQLGQEKKQLLRITEEMGGLLEQLEKVQKDYAVAETGLARLRTALEDSKSLLEEQKFQFEENAAEVRSLEQELLQLQKDRDIKQIQAESFRSEIRRNQEDQTQKQGELDAFAGNLASLSTEMERLEKVVTELRALKEAHDADTAATTQLITEGKDAIYKTNRTLDARMNEYNLTKSLVENLEGFPESVKFLKKEANWVKDAPLLSDIFYTPEAYKVAIENLLEPLLSHYVVDTRADALLAVKLLADASRGRASFFILEELESYVPAARQEIPGARAALDLVEVAPKYEKLAACLLDRVYVTEEDAEIPSTDLGELWFVTRTGGMMRRQYSLSGGSIGLFQGKRLGRAKNLEKLDKEIKKLEKELNTQKNELLTQEQKLEGLRKLNYATELEQRNQEYVNRKQELTVLQMREQEYRDFINRAGERSELIEKQVEELSAALEQIIPRIGEVQQQHGSRAAVLEEMRRMYENTSAETAQRSQDFNTQNIAFIQLRNRLEGLQKDVDFREERMQALTGNESRLKAELEQTQADIHNLVDNSLQNDEEIVALYEQKKAHEDRTARYEEVAARVRNAITQWETEIRKERGNKEQLEERKNEIRDKVTDIKIQLNSLKERMSVEFQVDIADLDAEALFPEGGPEAVQPGDVEAEMLKMRGRLQSYGEINPMAVEAYNEMKERHDFISTQKKDLMEARQNLLNTIQDIDTTATQKFMDAFREIRENFQRVFRSLFQEGDTCDLTLENEGDVLESPIGIMAKPKGKRPLTINQLSGGEKTLTAISLLFAIYLLKPAPFCIFDEVDAPLDDANIDKFNGIVRQFSTESQFIIVTHNKRTMASTNVLYGVTMEEAGVSKAMGVDLMALNLGDN